MIKLCNKSRSSRSNCLYLKPVDSVKSGNLKSESINKKQQGGNEKMEYRKLPHGEEMISVIGMGSSVVGEQKEADIIKTVEYALDAGINYFDMAGGHATIFPAYGKALEGRRKDALLQVD